MCVRIYAEAQIAAPSQIGLTNMGFEGSDCRLPMLVAFGHRGPVLWRAGCRTSSDKHCELGFGLGFYAKSTLLVQSPASSVL